MSTALPIAAAPASTPMVLLPYQQRWCADTSPVKLCEKSRRVGLSWAEAADSALLAAEAAGMDVWYIGYSKDMALEFIRDCGDWAKHFAMAVSEIEEGTELFEDGDDTKAILAYTIRFASGYRVTALSSRPTNLRGKQGRVIIDEAAFHPDLDGLIKAAMALLMWGGQVRIISTHDGDENPFNVLLNDVRAGRVPYSVHRITLDEALAEGLFQRICLRTGKPWTPAAEALWRAELVARYRDNADEELFCVPSKGSGAWLSRILVEKRMVAGVLVHRYSAPPGADLLPKVLAEVEIARICREELKPLVDALDPERRHVFGMDFARLSDLSVYFPLAIGTDLVRHTPFTVELSNVPFEWQKALVFYMTRRLPRFSAAMLDAGGNGAYLAEVCKGEFGADRVTEVRFSERWYLENGPPMKAALEDGTLLLPKHDDIATDLVAFKLVKGVPRIPDLRTKGTDGLKRHGDAGIACMLAYAASRQDYVPLESFTTGIERETSDTELADYFGDLHG